MLAPPALTRAHNKHETQGAFMKKIWAAAAAAAAFSAGLAHAKDDAGLYTHVTVGEVNGGGESHRRNGGQLSVGWAIGYHFNDTISAETFGRSLEFALLTPRRDYGYPDRHLGIAVVGRYPLMQFLSVNARVGLGQTEMRRDDGGRVSNLTSVSGGVGAALELGRHFAITAGYERYTRIDAGILLFGVQASF